MAPSVLFLMMDGLRLLKAGTRITPQLEIVKCYVDPAYRRYGIGSLLVQELGRIVTKMRYTTLYLHTHRFLPGAVDFWERQGFTFIAEEQNEWQIVHMDKFTNI